MRYLIDKYIDADEPRKISPFDDMSLLDIVAKTGIAAAISNLPAGLKKSQDAVAETIENNVRSKIVKEQLADPAFYETMSALLDEIIAARGAKAIEYEEYLKKIADLMTQLQAGHADDTPGTLDTPAKRALYGLLEHNEALALRVHEAIVTYRPDGWRGVPTKELAIKKAMYDVLQDPARVEAIFPTVTAQTEY